MADSVLGRWSAVPNGVAVALTTAPIPAGTYKVLVQAQGGTVRWTADGTAPTASLGFVIPDTLSITTFWNPTALKFFAAAAIGN